MNDIIGDYTQFLATILSDLQEKGINLEGEIIDHLAYRCVSETNYEQMKEKLDTVATRAFERTFNDRHISIYRLSKTLDYDDFQIPDLELMSYREGDKFKEGLEHIEVVVNDPLSLPNEYPDLQWTVVPDRTINKEVFITMGKYAVKFHSLPVEEAITKQIETD